MSKSNLSVGTKIWADKINAAWRNTALMVAREVGAILLQAKQAVPHGDFERMVKDELDFTPQTARKLMAVAADQRLLNRAPERELPDHWTTYYELTKLSDDELDKAFKSGVIRADMRRADVPKRKKSPQGDDAVQVYGDRVPAGRSDAVVPPPQTDAKGEDSAVIYEDESGAVDAPDDGLRPGYRDPDESVVLRVAPDPMSRFTQGLMLAMAASLELDPKYAAMHWPPGMPLAPQEIIDFYTWLYPFEDALRVRSDDEAAE